MVAGDSSILVTRIVTYAFNKTILPPMVLFIVDVDATLFSVVEYVWWYQYWF